MFNFIYKNRYLLVLSIIVMILIGLNYTPGTWLTGWDNLHPEFNFQLNIYRSFFSVWQEYQGLGLLAGMAHASDLIRQIFLWIASLFMPTSTLRYFFHFLMLAIGTIGTYHLLNRNILSEHGESIKKKGAFLGGLFYLLNFGTIQYFYTPFEPYSSFWGFFPWEIFILLELLNKPSKKNFVLFALINLIATPQAYVQTIFLVYMICVFVILGVNYFINRTKKNIYLSLKALLIIFCINAFWLIPNLYFTFKNVKVTQNAMNNIMNNQRFFETNKKRGTLKDFALFRGFYYDFTDLDRNTNQPIYMMSAWRNHFNSITVEIIGLTFFGVSLLGLIKKNKYRPYLLSLLAVVSIPLLSNTPILSDINSVFRTLPIVSQIIRNPFTKFIVPEILIISLGFGLGVVQIMKYLSNKKSKIALACTILIAAILVLYCQPAFKGNLIYSRLKTNIPKEYFELFDFFKSKSKNSRIMNLPQDSYWGWGSYKWGPIGSGFIWYGIEQPIMDRAFDVWSDKLEQYYWELNYALKKKDRLLFDRVLKKYQIKYIIFDDNYSPSDSASTKALLDQEKMLNEDGPIVSFGGIKVYDSGVDIDSIDNVGLIKSAETTIIGNNYDFTDKAYGMVGNYIQSEKDNTIDIYFPFQKLFTNRFQNENKGMISKCNNYYEIISDIPEGKYNINMPRLVDSEALIPVNIFAEKQDDSLLIRLEIVEPSIYINEKPVNSHGDYFNIITQTEESSFMVEINNKDFFKINNLVSDQNYIGSTYLINNGIENKIKIYGGIESIAQRLISSHSILPNDFTLSDKEAILIDNSAGGKLKLKIQKNDGVYVYKNIISNSQYQLTNVDHNYLKENNEFNLQKNEEGLSLYAKDNYLNFWTDIENWEPASGYIVDIKSRNVSGMPTMINIISIKDKIKFVNTFLNQSKLWTDNYFVLPPFYEFDEGLRILFNNSSFNDSSTLNDIKDISVHPFPFNFLTNVYLSKLKESPPEINNIFPEVTKSSISQYRIKLNADTTSTLILSQSFNPGWVAIANGKFLPHVLVNNWANGWKIPVESQKSLKSVKSIKIIFWPQYLEFLGFILLIIAFLVILRLPDQPESQPRRLPNSDKDS